MWGRRERAKRWSARVRAAAMVARWPAVLGAREAKAEAEVNAEEAKAGAKAEVKAEVKAGARLRQRL